MRYIIYIVVLILMGFGIYFGRNAYRDHMDDYNRLQDLEQKYENVEIMDKDAFEAFRKMDGEWSKIELNVTSYYPSTKYPEGGVLNAFNIRLKPYKSCAVDPSVIPYGSLLYCPGDDRIRIADDCGSHIKGKDLDLCMATEKEMRAWKNGYYEVWVWMPNN